MLGGQTGRLRCRSVALLVSPSRAVPRYGAFFNGLLAGAESGTGGRGAIRLRNSARKTAGPRPVAGAER